MSLVLSLILCRAPSAVLTKVGPGYGCPFKAPLLFSSSSNGLMMVHGINKCFEAKNFASSPLPSSLLLSFEGVLNGVSLVFWSTSEGSKKYSTVCFPVT